jgi:hypothetical protein
MSASRCVTRPGRISPAKAGGSGSIAQGHQYGRTVMHSGLCDLPEVPDRRHGLEGPVSPLATGDPDHTGDRNLPAISTRSPVSPVSPVARTREVLRSTTRFGDSGRVLYARVNSSEPCGGGGDTGDTSADRTGKALHLRGPNAAGDRRLGGGRLAPVRTNAPIRSDVGGATIAASVSSELRALAGRVRRVGLNGRFDLEAAFIERDELAHALRRLADRLEHRAGQLTAAAPATATRVVLPRRFAVVLAAKASEIARLRALLAQAVRPGRHRRRSASATQLMLPLSEIANDR